MFSLQDYKAKQRQCLKKFPYQDLGDLIAEELFPHQPSENLQLQLHFSSLIGNKGNDIFSGKNGQAPFKSAKTVVCAKAVVACIPLYLSVQA